MVGAVEHLTLLLLARTNHTFPGYRGGGGIRKKAESAVSEGGSLNLGGEVGVFGGKLYPPPPPPPPTG